MPAIFHNVRSVISHSSEREWEMVPRGYCGALSLLISNRIISEFARLSATHTLQFTPARDAQVLAWINLPIEPQMHELWASIKMEIGALVGWPDRSELEHRAAMMHHNHAFARSRRWIEGMVLPVSPNATAIGFTRKSTRPMASRLIERGLRVRILTGFSLIIVLTLAIAAWSYYHISTLSTSAEHVFIENYRSISYMHAMENALLTMETLGREAFPTSDVTFRQNLALEYKNITEPGELELTKTTEHDYATFIANPSKKLGDIVRADCEANLKLNERAMFARSEAFKAEGDFARNSTIAITLLLMSAAIVLAVAVSRRSLAEFQELDRAKSNFVATAAHELKNPLATIKTTSGMLADGMAGSLTTKQTELLTSIRTETNRLLNLVRELLDLAKLEAGTLQLNRISSDLESVIESAVFPVAMRAEEAGVSIDIAVAKSIPRLNVDSNKMAWAITNLISNAIRYSPRGDSVTVTANIIENEIWISVTDRGKGISEINLSKIFDKFVQVEESAMGIGSGTGLGLSIAREIVLAHGGRIFATSTLGKGSTFTMALPIQ